MLSSAKLDTLLSLLLQLLIATTSVQSAIFERRAILNTTTTVAEEKTTTQPTTPTPTLPPVILTLTLKVVEEPTNISSTPNSLKNEIFERNVKIIFPINDSDEETKYDIYGIKTTPKPEDQIKEANATNTTDSTSLTDIITVTTNPLETENNNNTNNNSTIKSLDDRLGILNLAPRCPEGHIVVNQHCHRQA